MVVAQVVRVSNTTLRTFEVVAGDYFYTPAVDGKPCPGGAFVVPPGFDQAIEGLIVPWESMTSSGLELTESGVQEAVRCVVAPLAVGEGGEENDRDWLQIRSKSWKNVMRERWLPLGQRHMLGTIGNTVDVQLTFRDARSPGEGSSSLEKVVHFNLGSKCAPHNTVFLNVFDLASALSVPNSMLCNTMYSTVGAFHAAVEVYGEEWSFYRTPNPQACGVCKSLRPRQHPVHVYRQSLNMGTTSLKDWEVRYLIRGKLVSMWPGGHYDLLSRNCIHFCEELLLQLGVNSVPPWVRGLHETGASVLSVPWPLSSLVGPYLWGAGSRAIPDATEDDLEPAAEVADSGSIASETCSQSTTMGGKLVGGRWSDVGSRWSDGGSVESQHSLPVGGRSSQFAGMRQSFRY